MCAWRYMQIDGTRKCVVFRWFVNDQVVDIFSFLSASLVVHPASWPDIQIRTSEIASWPICSAGLRNGHDVRFRCNWVLDTRQYPGRWGRGVKTIWKKERSNGRETERRVQAQELRTHGHERIFSHALSFTSTFIRYWVNFNSWAWGFVNWLMDRWPVSTFEVTTIFWNHTD